MQTMDSSGLAQVSLQIESSVRLALPLMCLRSPAPLGPQIQSSVQIALDIGIYRRICVQDLAGPHARHRRTWFGGSYRFAPHWSLPPSQEASSCSCQMWIAPSPTMARHRRTNAGITTCWWQSEPSAWSTACDIIGIWFTAEPPPSTPASLCAQSTAPLCRCCSAQIQFSSNCGNVALVATRQCARNVAANALRTTAMFRASWVIGQITGLCVTLCIKLFITIHAAHLTMPGLQYIRARRCALNSICALRLRLKSCLTDAGRSLRTSFAMVTGCQEMSRQCYLSVRDEH